MSVAVASLLVTHTGDAGGFALATQEDKGVLIASLSQFVILLRLLGDLSAHASYGIILMIGRVYTSNLPAVATPSSILHALPRSALCD